MSDSKSGGIGFAGLLAVLFVGLKLTNVISWSWWWVLSPLWISTLIGLMVLVSVAIIFVLASKKS